MSNLYKYLLLCPSHAWPPAPSLEDVCRMPPLLLLLLYKGMGLLSETYTTACFSFSPKP
ncbi:hypothetical protein BABINDRAFT_163170 [Babjeviella inositovora NRRL Y-12698]|uniref:Uncharacterized protein n=1 Tax=Babjeviella inositovora NRRL Y-12698 TaxID=984486 RepID=A0A1E3QL12_9ASCO|nr:uncharacterized protein BABINDRAFT_163170 [Babjeviella inositovora NRRL Y-12698]ODQ77772.1 hypothetical protein BABINDRAFT_163170 [Babjeviella inositovora NRRL Y-12698]